MTDTQMWHFLSSSLTPGTRHEGSHRPFQELHGSWLGSPRPTARPCITSFTASYCLVHVAISCLDSSSFVYHPRLQRHLAVPCQGPQWAKPMPKSPSLHLGYQYSLLLRQHGV